MDNATPCSKKCRKKYDSEDTKRRLLKAALDIFAKEGYDGSTTRAIAKKAGVNDALIQRYFNGKLGLLLALSLQFRERAINILINQSHETLEQELDAFFRGRLAFTHKHKKFIKIMITQAIVNTEFRAQMSRVSNEAAPCLLKNLITLQASGSIDPSIDLQSFVRMITTVSTGLGLITQVIDIGEIGYAEEFIPTFVKLLCSSMRPASARPKAA